MLYDIFDKSMILDFMGKVLKIIGNEKLVDVSNSVSSYSNDFKQNNFTEVSAIIYIFLAQRLPDYLRYMEPNKEENPLLEELKSLINECQEKTKNGGWNLEHFLYR